MRQENAQLPSGKRIIGHRQPARDNGGYITNESTIPEMDVVVNGTTTTGGVPCVMCKQPITLPLQVIYWTVGVDHYGRKIIGEFLIHWACAWNIQADMEAERRRCREGEVLS